MKIDRKVANTYYVGSISCATNNAMMKEIAAYLKTYEHSLIEGAAAILYGRIKEDIDVIYKKYPRCKPVTLQMTATMFGVAIYANKSGSDTSIISMFLGETLLKITL